MYPNTNEIEAGKSAIDLHCEVHSTYDIPTLDTFPDRNLRKAIEDRAVSVDIVAVDDHR